MILKHGTTLLVADGSHMMVLQNRGDTVAPDLAVVEHRAIDSEANREILSDAPGVSFSSMGYGHDTHGQTDAHQQREDRFIAEAVSALAKTANGNDGEVIIVAPPTALGVLRAHIKPALKKRVIAEIAKDLTNHPVDEIARLVQEY
ncbi:Host attachment protein [Altererythrobacter confluentis]|uniref:Host attachment protein n=1 Tax=Allopontixanthobacter confluentis TaxID=1849021 RepID=A0A6L7GAR6_9SPHN|nr:host attachment family protein [Allopontixanthobacter confluentis]MXP13202.1 Host attachment protein [Allopontixanthobacter confluentis]